MKIMQIVGPGRCEIREAPIPEPGPHEVCVKVHAVTTCAHWDMHILGGQPMFPGMELQYPYAPGQPGHEACGEIVACGPDVVEELTVGQRVCAWRDPGHERPGCYAEYVTLDAAHVLPIPAGLPATAWAPLELAMCVSAHVLFAEHLDAIAGKRVGVFGLGPAGLLFVQIARAAGAAAVLGIDPLPARRALAGQLGASATLEPEAARQDLPPRGHPGALDTAFDCAGSPHAVHRALEKTNLLVVLFAVQREPYTFSPSCWPGLILAGTRPHTREAAEYARDLVIRGRLDLAAIVTHTLSLGDYARGVDLLRSQEAIKVAFTFD